jgi:hypothetical protein
MIVIWIERQNVELLIVRGISMDIHYRLKDETVVFIITDLDPQYHQAAQDTGYTQTDEGFVREVLTDTEGRRHDFLERILTNAEEYLETLFAQKARLQPVLWEQALLTFLKMVEGKNIDWWLVGSAATAARGIDIQPGDIDLCTSEADALTLQNLLSDSVIQPLQDSTGWVGKWFGRAFLGARLEWVGGLNESSDAGTISDFGLLAHSRLEMIQWNGYAIRVPPLDLQLETSVRRGLTDRAEKIRKAISY